MPDSMAGVTRSYCKINDFGATHLLGHYQIFPLALTRYNNDVIFSRFMITLSSILGVALALSTPAAFAATEVFPLRDVRAGQRAVGRTVFSGSKVEEFQVEILGLLQNIGPRESIILARLSGGPLATTGVMQGMSGSPVYI